MKTTILFVLLSINTFLAQSQTINGIYANRWESTSGEVLSYELTLREDGTFTFISTRIYLEQQPNSIAEAEGTWELDGRLLVLATQDNHPLAIHLNGNKARYISTSPRSPNFNLVKPSLKFYESKVFYAKNMELIKTETNLTIHN